MWGFIEKLEDSSFVGVEKFGLRFPALKAGWKSSINETLPVYL